MVSVRQNMVWQIVTVLFGEEYFHFVHCIWLVWALVNEYSFDVKGREIRNISEACGILTVEGKIRERG